MDWNQIVQAVITIIGIPLLGKLIFNKYITTATRKNQAIEWFNIAQGIISLIMLNNPNLPQEKIIQDALNQIEAQIDGINPGTAERIVRQAYITLKSAGK